MNFYQNSHLIIKGQTNQKGNLWLGDYDSARNKKKLKEREIFYVITAGLGMKITYSNQFKHKIYPLYDSEMEKIDRFFEDSYFFIQEALKNGNILVHCFAGVSRSATLVIAYLMRKNNLTFKNAFQKVKKNRPYIGPNRGFLRQLRQFQKTIEPKSDVKQIKDINNLNQIKKQKQQQVNFIYSVTNYTSKFNGSRGLSYDPLKNYQKMKNTQKRASIGKVKNIQIATH